MESRFKKNVKTVFVGNIVYLLVTVVIYLLLFRWLETKEYAILVVLLAVVDGLTEVSDLGLNTSLIKSLSKYSSATRNRLSVAYVLRLKLLFIVFVTSLFFLLNDSLLSWVFSSSVSAIPMGLVLAVIGISILREFHFTILLAQRRYKQYRNARLMNRLVIFVAITLVYVFGGLSIGTALWAFFIAAAVVSVRSYKDMLLYFSYAIKKIPVSVKSDIAATGKWMSISGFLALIITRLDVFFLSHYSLLVELAYYAVIFKLASVILVMVRSFSQVYLPVQMTRIGDSDMAKTLSRKLTLVAVAGIAIVWLFVDVGLAGVEVVTSKNMPAIADNIMVILTASFLVALMSSPFSQFLIAHEQAHKLVFLNLVQLGIVTTINYFFIPIYGVYAPVIAILLYSFVGYVSVMLLVFFGKIEGNIGGLKHR